MKLQSLVLCGLIAVTSSTMGFALTIELEVTTAYVHEHPKEWSVKATKKESGLIEFTVVRTLSEPKYLVAHLAVHHAGKLIATSDTPLFAKLKGNTFYFSISEEDIAESKFDLSESGLGSTVNGVAMDFPVVGSNVYHFRLLDFTPEDVVEPGPGKCPQRRTRGLMGSTAHFPFPSVRFPGPLVLVPAVLVSRSIARPQKTIRSNSSKETASPVRRRAWSSWHRHGPRSFGRARGYRPFGGTG